MTDVRGLGSGMQRQCLQVQRSRLHVVCVVRPSSSTRCANATSKEAMHIYHLGSRFGVAVGQKAAHHRAPSSSPSTPSSRADVSGRRMRSRTQAVLTLAMVNVDFASPSLVLGAALIGCGVLLLQMRNLQTQISRDADIVVAAMVSIVGSTLIFQGWRLDPLLLLCQALTTSVAFWYGLEAFRLRAKAEEQQGMLPPPPGDVAPQAEMPAFFSQQQQQQQQQQPYQQYGAPLSQQQQQAAEGFSGGYLPPVSESQSYYPWAGQQEEQPGAGPSRWGPAPAAPSATIRYDYYGNPVEQYSEGQQYDGQQYAAGPGPGQDPYVGAGTSYQSDGAAPSGQQYGASQYFQQYGAYPPEMEYPAAVAPAGVYPGQQQQQAGYEPYAAAAGPSPMGEGEAAWQQPAATKSPAKPLGDGSAGSGRGAVRVFEPVDDWE